jgi:hypothetical protein
MSSTERLRLCNSKFHLLFSIAVLNINRRQIMAKKATASKFMAPVTPSEKLAAVVGSVPIPGKKCQSK